MDRDIIEKLLSYPQRGQIWVDFDLQKGLFRLTVPVFNAVEGVPSKVKNYVTARKNSTFKPHSTSYHLFQNKVLLVQELPFTLEAPLRIQADQFWQMSQACHKIFAEIAAEETNLNMLDLLS